MEALSIGAMVPKPHNPISAACPQALEGYTRLVDSDQYDLKPEAKLVSALVKRTEAPKSHKVPVQLAMRASTAPPG